jgi:hypothetical protein
LTCVLADSSQKWGSMPARRSARVLVLAFAVAACRAKQVDPAYLQALELAASAECACNNLPEQIDSCENPYPRYPTPPAGEPQAFLQYEASLDDSSKGEIAASRAKLERCQQVRAQASAFKGVVDQRQEQLLHPDH